MATIRMSMSALAAFAALLMPLPASAQTASRAPLDIIAVAKDDAPARTAARKATKKKKVSRKSVSRKSRNDVRTAGKQSVRAAMSRSARRATERRTAEKAQQRAAASEQAHASAAEREQALASATASEPAMASATASEQAMASAAGGHVMHGADSVSLIARLPWWRSRPMQNIQYGSTEAENQVMKAAEAWLAEHGVAETELVIPENARLASAEASTAAYAFEAADGSQGNAMDLAALDSPLSQKGMLPSLIAMLAGALAAAAVSARFLFA